MVGELRSYARASASDFDISIIKDCVPLRLVLDGSGSIRCDRICEDTQGCGPSPNALNEQPLWNSTSHSLTTVVTLALRDMSRSLPYRLRNNLAEKIWCPEVHDSSKLTARDVALYMKTLKMMRTWFPREHSVWMNRSIGHESCPCNTICTMDRAGTLTFVSF